MENHNEHPYRAIGWETEDGTRYGGVQYEYRQDEVALTITAIDYPDGERSIEVGFLKGEPPADDAEETRLAGPHFSASPEHALEIAKQLRERKDDTPMPIIIEREDDGCSLALGWGDEEGMHVDITADRSAVAFTDADEILHIAEKLEEAVNGRKLAPSA